MKIIQFLKNWALILSMVVGVSAYFIYVNVPFLRAMRPFFKGAVGILQPLLIFAMLFLAFCKISPKKLRLCKWHLWLLLFQVGTFVLLSVILILLPHSGMRVVIEGAMICLICPTATAGAIITKKLGGNASGLATYTILINLVVALLVPALLPFVHPHPDQTWWNASAMILGKVFPLLLLPLFAAILLRYLSPRLHFIVSRHQELSFYLWTIALALATVVTVRSVMHSEVGFLTEIWLVIVSLVCCLAQFYIGRKIGLRYNTPISASQSLGQKNTVLAIWMGYAFFTPVTSIVGGFYSIWHNLVNSYQLYRQKKRKEREDHPVVQ